MLMERSTFWANTCKHSHIWTHPGNAWAETGKKLYAADRNWPTFVYQGPVSPGSHLALYTSKKIHSHNTGYCARPLRNNLENKRATIDAKLAFMAIKKWLLLRLAYRLFTVQW